MKFIRFEMAGKAEIGILNKEETGILPLSGSIRDLELPLCSR